ncbi:hypothetical protein PG994_010516 [Apiospora phragmitis]|uniref:Uncharacterized protein n=1 Tax=Apiospora phragmitis TaxID=2905665 RepID=A0ABR1TSB9_9PEZI
MRINTPTLRLRPLSPSHSPRGKVLHLRYNSRYTARIRVFALDGFELVEELAALAAEQLPNRLLGRAVHLAQALDVERARLRHGLDDLAARLGEQDGLARPVARAAVAGRAGVDHDGGPVGLLLLVELRARQDGQVVEAAGELPVGRDLALGAQLALLHGLFRHRQDRARLDAGHGGVVVGQPLAEEAALAEEVLVARLAAPALGPPVRVLVLVVEAPRVAHLVREVGHDVAVAHGQHIAEHHPRA